MATIAPTRAAAAGLAARDPARRRRDASRRTVWSADRSVVVVRGGEEEKIVTATAGRGLGRTCRGLLHGWGVHRMHRAGGTTRAMGMGHMRGVGAPAPSPSDVVPDAFRYATAGSARGCNNAAAAKDASNGTAASASASAHQDASGEKKEADGGIARGIGISGGAGAKKLRVAYQGMPGAYSEAAALTAYPTCEPCPHAQFENAFEATEQWTADRAVLPFENSLGGSIHRNYDLILNHSLHIVGEVYFKVNHCLVALPGQTKADLKRAMSHPQALAQCDGYLTDLGLIKEAVDDTAGAAAYIKENDLMGVAAVASSRAAELYGMEVLDEGIQDDKSNVTRFLALAREPLPPRAGVPYKTSIACSFKEEEGALFKALACFALRDINLTKVESRPMRWNPVTQAEGSVMQFSYLFYIDFEASMADANAQNALRQLQETAIFLRVLGSYPADDSKLN